MFSARLLFETLVDCMEASSERAVLPTDVVVDQSVFDQVSEINITPFLVPLPDEREEVHLVDRCHQSFRERIIGLTQDHGRWTRYWMEVKMVHEPH